MIRAVLVALCLAAPVVGPVAADPFPATYSVSGVAADDRLNIRAEPRGDAPVLDHIGPFALNIEVLEVTPDGRWGMVPTGDGVGWVAMRFLAATPWPDPQTLPRPMSCLGTEPFWSIAILPRGAEETTPETGRTDLTVTAESVAPEGYLVTLEEGPTRTYTLTISRASCSDGMSDRRFGLTATLYTQSPDGNRLARGCCTLDHR